MTEPFIPPISSTEGMTPQQRHEFNDVLQSGDQRRYEEFAARIAGLQLRPGNETPAPEVAGHRPAEPATDGPGPTQGPGEVEPDDPARTAMAERLTELGSDIEAFDALVPDADRWSDRLTGMSEADMVSHFEAGEQQIIRGQFRNNVAEYEHALKQIGEAARKIGGDRLAQEIADSGALFDPEMFLRAHLLAQHLLSGGGTPS